MFKVFSKFLDLNQREELKFKMEQVTHLYDDIRERERQDRLMT